MLTKNPFQFTTMEKWCCQDKEFQGYVGYTKDGTIYLTWDEREDNIPIFSEHCKVGKLELVTMEDFKIFRNLFQVLNNRWIEEIKFSDYRVIGFNKLYTFDSEIKTVSPAPINIKIVATRILNFLF